MISPGGGGKELKGASTTKSKTDFTVVGILAWSMSSFYAEKKYKPRIFLVRIKQYWAFSYAIFSSTPNNWVKVGITSSSPLFHDWQKNSSLTNIIASGPGASIGNHLYLIFLSYCLRGGCMPPGSLRCLLLMSLCSLENCG